MKWVVTEGMFKPVHVLDTEASARVWLDAKEQEALAEGKTTERQHPFKLTIRWKTDRGVECYHWYDVYNVPSES